MYHDLIDTLWNVKQESGINGNTSTLDLIDTLWNVKEFNSLIRASISVPDLIDTLWNVKLFTR